MSLSRRRFLGVAANASWMVPLTSRLGAQPASASAAAPLDILVLMADQWNPWTLGYERDPDVQTPNLDALAAQSLNFTHCYTNCPVCMPARTSLMSGLFPHNTGLWANANKFYVSAEQTPLFSDVRARGYTTAQIGKFHWWSGNGYRRDYESLTSYFKALGLDHPDPISSPFSTGGKGEEGPYEEYLRKLGKLDAYVGDMARRLKEGQYLAAPSPVAAEEHNDWFIADRSIAFLRTQPKHKPFFLITSFPGPHTPLDAMGRYRAMYDPRKVKLAANVRAAVNEGRSFSLDEVRVSKASYLGKITLIDDCVGRIIAALKERGTWERTLVFFVSDHGEMMGAQGRFGKSVLWEESVRVPLLVRLPGQPTAGRRTDVPVQLSDLYGTVVEAAGGRVSKGRFTRSFLPVVRGGGAPTSRAAFSEVQGQGALNYMVRDHRHKWFAHGGKEHLFDLAEDPLEQRNLIASAGHREVVASLKEQQRQFISSTQINLSADYKPASDRARSENK